MKNILLIQAMQVAVGWESRLPDYPYIVKRIQKFIITIILNCHETKTTEHKKT